MLSVLSAYKIQQPDIIMFHTNTVPTGQYWDTVVALPTVKVLSSIQAESCRGKDPILWFSYSVFLTPRQ